VPSFTALLHRTPRFDFEGVAARRRHRRERFVAFLAFVLSLSAVGGVVLAWALELGFGGFLGRLAPLLG
jgi:hypothetical protein